MSTGLDKDHGSAFVEAAVPLLKEYSGKLTSSARELFELIEDLRPLSGNQAEKARFSQLSSRLDSVRARVRRLQPAVKELDRRVSQMIQHGQLDSELDRVELRLRLAELEAALDEAVSASHLFVNP